MAVKVSQYGNARRLRALEDALRWIENVAPLDIARFASSALIGEPVPDFTEDALRPATPGSNPGALQPGEDDRPKPIDLPTLAHYEVIQVRGMVATLCRRCPSVQLISRDLDGDQSDLMLDELVEEVTRHECESHG